MASTESIAAFRFGYGFRPGEAPARPGAMLAGVSRSAAAASGHPSTLAEREAGLQRFLKVSRAEGASDEERRTARRAFRQGLERERMARIAVAALSAEGFYERLVWFWTDHFTVSTLRGGYRAAALVPAFEAEAIRPNIAGDFATLLAAAVKHPAMLDYLGQSRSVGPTSPAGRNREEGLNENLAREVIELHTLGVGADYRQKDVRQFAELLTGLRVDRDAGAAVFRGRMAEPGAETVLGTRYGGGEPSIEAIDSALADLALHPATARHVARKLAVHFVADDPPEDLVAELERGFAESGGDLVAVYAVLLDHPASWGEVGAKVRQPFDYVVASLRAALPAGARDFERFRGTQAANPAAALGRMNQPVWGAGGPDGWPEAGEAWVTAPGLVARIDWASRMGAALGPEVDPRDFVEAALGDLARDNTRFAATAAAERWEGIALVLAAPEFNRR